MSQQARGWYVIMLAPVRGSEEKERFLAVREAAPEETRVFWTTKESLAFRFPNPESAYAAQTARGVENIEHAWVIYRS